MTLPHRTEFLLVFGEAITEAQSRVILAVDGLQPDVGHEVLWGLRDCLSSVMREPSDSTEPHRSDS